MMTADNGALEPCSICLELTVEWLARRGSCCGELTCRPCRATLEKTPVPGGSGRMQSESCPVCRQSLPRTQAELVKRLRERAALGHAGAQAELGEAMVRGHLGLRVDEAAGVELLESAAVQSYAESLYRLAQKKVVVESSVPQIDVDAALVLFRRAAAQGHLQAMCSLGIALRNDAGTPAAHAEVVTLARHVIDAYTGSHNSNWFVALACYDLGVATAQGKGVAQNNEEALWWWRRSAKGGCDYAAADLTRLDGNFCHAPSCTAKSNGKPFMRCARCKCAHYCSAECQAAHWPGHKKTCKRLAAMPR